MRIERYNVPPELNALLWRWGRSKHEGMPRLGYPSQAAACGEYRAPGYREERPPYNYDYDKLLIVIDVLLAKPNQRVLELRYREKAPPRVCAKEFQITKEQYLDYFERVVKRVEFLLKEDELIEKIARDC